MIFSKKSIEGLLNGVKTQTRRLVKEGEHELVDSKNCFIKEVFRCNEIAWKDYCDNSNNNYYDVYGLNQRIGLTEVLKSKRVKWLVGRDYAVQTGRGKKGLMINYVSGFVKEFEDVRGSEMDTSKPLRVVVTGIRKEKLLDISEEDAKQEGYEMSSSYDAKNNFLINFVAINYKKIPKSIHKYAENKQKLFSERQLERAYAWNPFVWVLDLKIKE